MPAGTHGVAPRMARDLTLLLALVCVVYANAFHAGFTLDNDFFILGDERVHTVSVENLRRILSEDYAAPRFVTGVYRPLTTLSFLFNYSVLGGADDPVGYHAVNLLLHFGNVVLVYLLALALVAGAWNAFFVAALFAAHPIATEAVTNIVGRGDMLACGSVLAGTLLYLRSVDARGGRRVAWLAALAGVTMLGVFAKESAVAILGAMLAYDLVYRLRSRPADGLATLGREAWRFFRTGYVALVPPFAALLLARAAVYRGVAVRTTPFLENPLVAANLGTRLLTAAKVLGIYVARLVWPASLSCDYSYDAIPVVQTPPATAGDWLAWVVLVALVAAIVGIVRQRRRNPALAFFGLFALLTFLPISNVPLVIGTIMGERLAYLPSVGLAGCVVVGFDALARRRAATGAGTSAPNVVRALLALLIVGYGVRTTIRNLDWKDTLPLFESATRAAPGSFKVHQLYARALAAADPGLTNLDRVVAEEERALAIVERSEVPAEARSWSLPQSLAQHLAMQAQRLERTSPERHALLARSAELLTRAAEVNHTKEVAARARTLGGAASQDPPLGAADIDDDLGQVRLELEDLDGAAQAFRDLAGVAPDDPRAQIGLARVHRARGESDQAALRLVTAIVLDSSRHDALRMLVDLYRETDPNGCALAPPGSPAPLDWTCPTLHATLCAADAELIAAFTAANARAGAEELRRNSIAFHNCSPDALP